MTRRLNEYHVLTNAAIFCTKDELIFLLMEYGHNEIDARNWLMRFERDRIWSALESQSRDHFRFIWWW